jgi:hypothetical protein
LRRILFNPQVFFMGFLAWLLHEMWVWVVRIDGKTMLFPFTIAHVSNHPFPTFSCSNSTRFTKIQPHHCSITWKTKTEKLLTINVSSYLQYVNSHLIKFIIIQLIIISWIYVVYLGKYDSIHEVLFKPCYSQIPNQTLLQ